MGEKIAAINIGGSDEAVIWRYMDLPKFVATLASGTLWFPKMAHLEDCYEGFCEALAREMPAIDPLAKCVTRTISDGETAVISLTQFAVELSKNSAAYFQNARDHLYVNSWCQGNESMAMWEIYGSKAQGVAIRSSVRRYVKAARFELREEQFSFGRVEYEDDPHSNPTLRFDFTAGPISLGSGLWEKLLPVAFHKRTCFEHEREWRCALYQDARPNTHGCNINFELDELMDSVIVGPRSDPFFFQVVGSVMEKFGLNKPLKRSDLLQPPRRHGLVQ